MPKIFDAVLGAIFPNKCISCGELIDSNEYLCVFCHSMIEYVELSKVCTRCGLPKKDCECQNRIFHFNAVTAPFINKGVAKKALYNLKFNNHSTYADFFAGEMAKAVKYTYYDIKFDGIVYVPMPTLKKLKRGFNQAEELAIGLSKILSVPVYYDVLKAKYSHKRQHDMSFKERFNNVKGLYSFKKKVTGKNILLVDDIKTTGATIDECAKQLLLAGADNVYCVTGLISVKDKDKSKKKGNKDGS